MDTEGTLEKRRLAEMIGKTKEEENRYSRAYGTGSLEFDQFQDLMKEAKKRKTAYQRQLADLADRSAKLAVDIDTDELVEEAQKVIKSLDFSDKYKIIRDVIDKVVVSERSGAEVWAHLPLPAIITEKLGYEPQRRDRGAAERGEVHFVQRAPAKAGGGGRQLSFLHD